MSNTNKAASGDRIFSISDADILSVIAEDAFPITDEEFNEICKLSADGLGEVWSDIVGHAIATVLLARSNSD